MNEFARRYGKIVGNDPRDPMAWPDDFMQTLEGNTNTLSRTFGGPERFMAYLRSVQPSRNVERRPYEHWNRAFEQSLVVPDDEQEEYGREYDDEQDTNPLNRPERDRHGEFRAWMADVLSTRGRR